MACEIKQRFERLIDHYAALCLALALVTLSLIGVGDLRTAALVGILLCGAGMAQDFARVDLWILLPLILYALASMASSCMAYGNIADGYGVMHALFPVIYLLMGCLDEKGMRLLRRCCALWTGIMAAMGIGRFVFQAVTTGRTGRMAGPLGNSNAMGIFLVTGWFTLMYCTKEDADRNQTEFLFRLEPVLLIALTLTLSMGSFLAMAMGIGVLLIEKKRTCDPEETFRYACRLLARIVLGTGTGMLIYLAAVRTNVPWICLPLLAYGITTFLYWNTFDRFLSAYPRTAFIMSALGILIAATAVFLRPSAAITFAERFEMMKSGLHYLTESPLFGVGPFRWRLLDMNDGGKYFNTWHIHNIPIHIGVEMGLFAMAMVILIGLRALSKKKKIFLRAGVAAFLFHNLIDTSFFYLGITALTLTAAGEPESEGRKAGGMTVKTVFALFAGLFAYSLYYTIR